MKWNVSVGQLDKVAQRPLPEIHRQLFVAVHDAFVAGHLIPPCCFLKEA